MRSEGSKHGAVRRRLAGGNLNADAAIRASRERHCACVAEEDVFVGIVFEHLCSGFELRQRAELAERDAGIETDAR